MLVGPVECDWPYRAISSCGMASDIEEGIAPSLSSPML